MDKDDSKMIDFEEAVSFWGKNFAKVNAKAMFTEVVNASEGCNSVIRQGDWVSFWEQVKQHGYSDESICEELENIMNGESWVDWLDGRNASSTSMAPKDVTPAQRQANRLQQATVDKLNEVFSSMDKDGSDQIDFDEAVNFWGKNFAKVNARAMFTEVVEASGSGAVIRRHDWIEFWHQVKKHDYSDEQIIEELDNIMNGESWVDWLDEKTPGNTKPA